MYLSTNNTNDDKNRTSLMFQEGSSILLENGMASIDLKDEEDQERERNMKKKRRQKVRERKKEKERQNEREVGKENNLESHESQRKQEKYHHKNDNYFGVEREEKSIMEGKREEGNEEENKCYDFDSNLLENSTPKSDRDKYNQPKNFSGRRYNYDNCLHEGDENKDGDAEKKQERYENRKTNSKSGNDNKDHKEIYHQRKAEGEDICNNNFEDEFLFVEKTSTDFAYIASEGQGKEEKVNLSPTEYKITGNHRNYSSSESIQCGSTRKRQEKQKEKVFRRRKTLEEVEKGAGSPFTKILSLMYTHSSSHSFSNQNHCDDASNNRNKSKNAPKENIITNESAKEKEIGIETDKETGKRMEKEKVHTSSLVIPLKDFNSKEKDLTILNSRPVMPAKDIYANVDNDNEDMENDTDKDDDDEESDAQKRSPTHYSSNIKERITHINDENIRISPNENGDLNLTLEEGNEKIQHPSTGTTNLLPVIKGAYQARWYASDFCERGFSLTERSVHIVQDLISVEPVSKLLNYLTSTITVLAANTQAIAHSSMEMFEDRQHRRQMDREKEIEGRKEKQLDQETDRIAHLSWEQEREQEDEEQQQYDNYQEGKGEEAEDGDNRDRKVVDSDSDLDSDSDSYFEADIVKQENEEFTSTSSSRSNSNNRKVHEEGKQPIYQNSLQQVRRPVFRRKASLQEIADNVQIHGSKLHTDTPTDWSQDLEYFVPQYP